MANAKKQEKKALKEQEKARKAAEKAAKKAKKNGGAAFDEDYYQPAPQPVQQQMPARRGGTKVVSRLPLALKPRELEQEYAPQTSPIVIPITLVPNIDDSRMPQLGDSGTGSGGSGSGLGGAAEELAFDEEGNAYGTLSGRPAYQDAAGDYFFCENDGSYSSLDGRPLSIDENGIRSYLDEMGLGDAPQAEPAPEQKGGKKGKKSKK